MMNNEFATALAPGAYDANMLRQAAVGRVIYPLAWNEYPETFVALVDGRVPPAIAWRNIIFWLDPDDTMSDADELTIIRTLDDFVYKVEDPDYRTRSVLSATVVAPPEDAAIGATYLVPAGAIEEWSSHQDDIAILTRNGWRFEVPRIGKWLLIEDVDGFVRLTASGWQPGPGARSFDAASIPFSAALGWGAKFEVENQTTTTPPIATKGLCYIVGDGAVGDWLGQDKKVAICEIPDTWAFYPPSRGWTAYDKSNGSEFTYDGSAWSSSAGAWVNFKCLRTVSGSVGFIGVGTHFNYGAGLVPSTAHRQVIDDAALTFKARSTGAAKLRFRWQGYVDAAETSQAAGNSTPAIALFRDSETNAIAAIGIGRADFVGARHHSVEFLVDVGDTNEHSYRITITSGRWSNIRYDYDLIDRSFSVEETF